MIFTDGFWPDEGSAEEPRIGAVVFDKVQGKAFCTSLTVPKNVITEWIPRKTQIAMVELIAPVVVNEVFADVLKGKKALLFVDSESVEGALVKGYSARADMSWLTAVFWDQLLDLRCLMYVDRVSTDANIADGPSRGRRREVEQGGWIERPGRIPESVLGGLGKFKGKLLCLQDLTSDQGQPD